MVGQLINPSELPADNAPRRTTGQQRYRKEPKRYTAKFNLAVPYLYGSPFSFWVLMLSKGLDNVTTYIILYISFTKMSTQNDTNKKYKNARIKPASVSKRVTSIKWRRVKKKITVKVSYCSREILKQSPNRKLWRLYSRYKIISLRQTNPSSWR